MKDAELEETARLVEWTRTQILRVRRVATDDRVKRSLRAIAFALHPRINPRIRFLEIYDTKGRWCMIRSGRKYSIIRALRAVREEPSACPP